MAVEGALLPAAGGGVGEAPYGSNRWQFVAGCCMERCSLIRSAESALEAGSGLPERESFEHRRGLGCQPQCPGRFTFKPTGFTFSPNAPRKPRARARLLPCLSTFLICFCSHGRNGATATARPMLVGNGPSVHPLRRMSRRAFFVLGRGGSSESFRVCGA